MMIHELNCGTLQPPSELLVSGRGCLFSRAKLVCRCLLVPTELGYTLIDAGLGLQDIAHPLERLGERFLKVCRPILDPRETAIHQVADRGIDPEQVTDIVITHLDLDHVGGISDFPWARIHVAEEQLELLSARLVPRMARRLHPEQWKHEPRWQPVKMEQEHLGRRSARISDGISMVALDGHFPGHTGVMVHRESQPDLIHAGDAIFSHRTLRKRPVPLGMMLFERQLIVDREDWRRSRSWLQKQHSLGKEIVCAHDPLIRPSR